MTATNDLHPTADPDAVTRYLSDTAAHDVAMFEVPE